MAKNKDTTANRLTGDIEIPESPEEVTIPSRRHEVLGVLTGLVALTLLLALVSYDGVGADGTVAEGGNLVGPVGAWGAYFAFSLLGLATYLVDLCLWVHAIGLFVGRAPAVRARGVLGALGVGLLAAVALHAFLHGDVVLGHAPGGFLGEVLGELSLSALFAAGTYIVTLGGIAVILLLVTDISLYLVLRAAWLIARRGGALLGRLALRIARAWREGQPGGDLPSEPVIVVSECPAAAEPVPAPAPAAAVPQEPKIVARTKKEKARDAKVLDLQLARPARGEFQLPPLSLLAQPEARTIQIDRAYLKGMAERLVRVLADFDILGEVREIHPGPVVTMFEFQPGAGTRLTKIERLSAELAMALEVKRVRVVAPIPGKNAVGFELPNREREIVRLREIVEDPAFTSPKAKLPLALGKDISGAPFTVDLAKMPHLLMAGTTGSGKSVAMNSMLLSLLLRHTPDDLRLLLIDPKMIEFQPYNEIPHLLLPVVTDMSQANQALKWAVDEMERRYQLFADIGARHLESYNRKVEKILEGGPDAPRPPAPDQVAWNERGELVEIESGEDARPPEKLPLIVIAIDELADLMMVAAKEVEISISRLAQKARAAGIHLIVATQRPSTDVVTGLIKANFPARLSCQVSSGIDSRTILLQNGAENLLGNGDMLVLPPGTSDLVRAQGAFVDDGEIKEVVDFLKAQGAPEYDDDILRPREDEGGPIDESEKDEVYDQAVAIVAEARFCSISMLQRKLRIGYNRSARLVEIMEREGVVGPANHQNKRDVLVSNPLP